ncbi:DUF551 domain-containing protein [Enterobacter hormaechei]
MSTITREFTKEQLQQIIETDHVQCGEASALARIALASLEAEPVPEWTNEQCMEFLSIAFRHAEINGDLQLDDIRLGVKMVNGSRAAMLQGAEQQQNQQQNIPENIPFEQWLSQQTGTIDVECGCVMTEVFFHWLRVAYEAGNSPVIPDGWVACSERMPPQGEPLLVCSSGGVVQRTVYGFDGENWLDWYEQYDPVKSELGDSWMPLPAAPQQEVKP